MHTPQRLLQSLLPYISDPEVTATKVESKTVLTFHFRITRNVFGQKRYPIVKKVVLLFLLLVVITLQKSPRLC